FDVMVVERASRFARWDLGIGDTEILDADLRPDAHVGAGVEGALRPAVELGIADVEDGRGHPTLPSSDTVISRCASTANSIGRCCSTSRTKPLTMRPTASSSLSPRC